MCILFFVIIRDVLHVQLILFSLEEGDVMVVIIVLYC